MATKFTPELIEESLIHRGTVRGYYQNGDDISTRKAIRLCGMVNRKDPITREWTKEVEYDCLGFGKCVRTVEDFCSCMFYLHNETH